MSCQGFLVKNEKNKKKAIIFVLIILILAPIIFSFYSISNQPRLRIGIVLTSDDLFHDGKIAVDGLNDFENIFLAELLNVRFNESKVRIKNGIYLTDDYFDEKFIERTRKNYNVDIIMILTDKKINNWLSNGIANTELATTLITAAQFLDNSTEHERYIKSTSIHEILHLLGYQHPTDDRDCVMKIAEPFEDDLNPEYKFELIYRGQFWQFGTGHDFVHACFLINLGILLILSPFFIVLIIIYYQLFKKHLYKFKKSSSIQLIMGIGGFAMNLLIISAFIQYFYLKIFLLFFSTFIYVILEFINYLNISRKENS
jgi:predicted Zn-dependent protease